jgi:predicted ester cyclase
VQALAAGDDAAARALLADSFVDHSPSWGTDTADAVLASYGELRRAMPDLRFDVDRENMVAERDQVAAHSIVRGTHTGEPLFGAEPSGNEIVWDAHRLRPYCRRQGGRALERERHAHAVPAGRRPAGAGRVVILR